MILGTVLGSTTLILVSGLNQTLGISDHSFMLGDSVMLTVLGQVCGWDGYRASVCELN